MVIVYWFLLLLRVSNNQGGCLINFLGILDNF